VTRRLALALVVVAGCGDGAELIDAPVVAVDAARPDAPVDAASPDAPVDAASPDAPVDAASPDAAIDAAAPDAAPDAPATDAAIDAPTDAPTDAAIDAPIDAPTPTPPIVTSILFAPPGTAAGIIELRIATTDTTSATLALAIDVSCDAQATWRPASILDDTDGLPATATAVLRWDSVPDLDFHAPRACFVRAVATDDGGLAGPPLVAAAPLIDNLREAARRVDHYMIHYGGLSTSTSTLIKAHQLVVLDPRSAALTRSAVAGLQQGQDAADPADDVIVLCYVSIGEDIRTANRTDAQLLADPRFVGNGTGPRVDPRGPGASGQPLTGLDPLGLPSDGGDGYASFYLDDNDVYRDGVGDGHPDRNANFGGAFVNAGDPAWYAAVRGMRLDSPDGVAGLDEILTTTAGRGLGCDGVFLDTLDTAAPNAFTDASSTNLSQFEWTANGFRLFIQHLRGDFPGKVILQNRGLFFFDPRHRQYALNAGPWIDFVLFESFRLDSSSAHEFHPYYYPDNRYNVAPKLMAEANRGAGFRVLSLGYAEGPSATMSELTLVGQSTLGLASLLEDIRVAQDETGFRHYLANSSLTRANRFVLDHGSPLDLAPPVWTSTWNDHNAGWPDMPAAPTPRPGVREVVPRAGGLTVRWDVALDLHRVHYVAYVQDHPFDLAGDPGLTGAARRPLVPRVGSGYGNPGVGPTRFAHEADLLGLTPGVAYHVIIRAVDDAAAANEDGNQRVMSGVPLL
jgi:hypothetical protein